MDRICVIGDSITHGTGDELKQGWPGVLFPKYPQLTVYNLGVRADTSELISNRWKQEAQARLPHQTQCGIIFAFGTNDSVIQIDHGIRVEIEKSVNIAKNILIKAKEWVPVLWIGPIPVIDEMQPFNSEAGVYDFNNSRIAAYNEAYVLLARDINISYLDLFTPLSSNARWQESQRSNDGVHPKNEGYQEIANIVHSWADFHDFMAI